MSSGCQIVAAKDVPRWVKRHGPGLRGPLNTELLYHHLVCPAAWVFLDVALLAEIRPGTLPGASRDARWAGIAMELLPLGTVPALPVA